MEKLSNTLQHAVRKYNKYNKRKVNKLKPLQHSMKMLSKLLIPITNCSSSPSS